MELRNTSWTWLLGLVVCWALIVLQRASYWTAPFLNYDESLWLIGGQMIKAGALPYRDFWFFTTPGVFYLYALSAYLTPWSTLAIRVLLTAFHCVTALVLWRLGALTSRPWSGLLAALAFSLSCSAFQFTDHQAAECEGFMILFSSAAVWFLLSALSTGSARRAFLSGVCSCLAFLIKQVAALDGLAIVMSLVLLAARGAIRRRQAAQLLFWIALGALLPAAAILLVFHLHGGLNDLVYCVFQYPFHVYTTRPDTWRIIGNAWWTLFLSNPAVYGTSVMATAMLPFALLLRRVDWLRIVLPILLWNAAALIGALLGRHPFAHYFLQTLPPACLMLGIGLGGFSAILPNVQDAQRAWLLVQRAATIFLLAAVSFPSIVRYTIGEHAHVPSWSSERQIGEFIRRRTGAEDRVFVWGFAMMVYCYSERLPACPDITSHFVSGWDPTVRNEDFDQRIVPGALKRCVSELRRTPPAFIVDYSPAGYVPLNRFPELARLVETEYKLAARFETSWYGYASGHVDLLVPRGAGVAPPTKK
jgi:hypothetical protein